MNAKLGVSLMLVMSAVLATGTQSVAQPAAAPGGMRLLPGYVHEPLQGIDSVVGKIVKKDGLQITYDIGRIRKPGGLALGGDFVNQAQQLAQREKLALKEQTINGQPMHLVYSKQSLIVSFPMTGINFHVAAKTPDDVADALLMILTYGEAKAKK